MKKLFTTFIFLFFSLSLLFAQEGGVAGNCGDGRDNDGDGFVDCYDKECSAELNCDDFFLNNDATCEVKPDSFPRFTIRKLWSTGKGSTTNHTTIVIGDIIGNDGIPEIIGSNSGSNQLTIFDGRDGSTIRSTKVNLAWQDYLATAKVGPDPACGYIYIASGKNLQAFDCNFNLVWQAGSGGVPNSYGATTAPGLADFNQDGVPEIYYANEIRNALTGQILVKGKGDWIKNVNAGSVAVDINPASPGLELVNGLTVYNINIASGTSTVWKSRPEYFIKTSFGGNQNHTFTSVADYDLDGYLDVIASGATDSNNGHSSVFLWEPETDYFKIHKTLNNWQQGTGRVNISNIDDTPGLNATFATGTKIYALDENFDYKWEVDIYEQTSGNTGSTVFDFNGDGKSEIVYRDERFLYIIQDGVDGGGSPAGLVRQAFPCLSRTGREYPVVADVNGDGQTEICVPCQHPSEAGYNPRELGEIVAFASDGEKWVPARKMWNQHAYFNVNINDDLTIPIEQQLHHLSFSDFLCELDAMGNPVPGKVRPLNNFLNQSPYLDLNGCPSYATPDIAFANAEIIINAPICPETEFSTSFWIKNGGDVPLNDDLNITFYKGNPNSGGQTLNTETIFINRLMPGDSIALDSIVVQGDGTSFDLYIWLNNPSTIIECNPDNNQRMVRVTPLPFNVEAIKLSENVKCDASYPDNGSAEAFVINGTDSVTAGYTFYWYDNAVDTLESTGANIGGLGNGTFYVTAINDAVGCGSDTAYVTVNDSLYAPFVDVVINKRVTSCITPNGEMQAYVQQNGIDASAEYTFTWFEGTQVYVNQHSVGQVASGLAEKTYLVLAQNATNGCSGVKTAIMPLDVVYPNINIVGFSDITACIDPFGSITAEATIGGVVGNPADFTFRWFDGNTDDPLNEIFSETGPAIDSLDSGYYTVKVVVDSTQCESIAQVQEIRKLTVEPNVNVALVAEKTSCIRPNGSLSATANGGTTGFNFEWFRGNNTTVALISPETTSGPNNSVAENLTDMYYTVRATETATGCFATDSMRVPENPLNITISNVNIVHQTMCWPRNGEAEAFATGGLSGQYDYYWFHNNPGTNPDTTKANFTGQLYTGLRNGDYWVVAADKFERCYSDAYKIDINPPAPLPDVTFNITPNATCDNSLPTGAITANVVSGNNSDYRYRWFVGQTTNNSFRLPDATLVPTAQVIGSSNETLIQVPDQIYTVRITDRNTNCNDTAIAIVPTGIPPAVVVTASANPVEACYPPDGEVSAHVGGNTTDFTFNWYSGNSIKVSSDFTGPTATDLTQGDYTVQAISNITGCVSDPVTVNVGYNSGIIDITFTPSTIANCIDPLGNIQTAITGGTGSFVYEWYAGADTIPANLISTDQNLNGISAGMYTLKVRDINNNCVRLDTTSVRTTEVTPMVSLSKLDMDQCIPPNGEVAAVVTNNGVYLQSDYTFYWFEGDRAVVDTSQPDGFAEDFNSANVNGLKPGQYTVIVQQNYGNLCKSDPQTIEVVETSAAPAITITSTANQNCAAPFNGELMASASTSNGQPEPGSGYDFNWFAGDINSLNGSSTSIGSGNNVTNHTLTGQNGEQFYSVIVTNQNTQCSDTVQHRLRNALVYPYFVSHVKNDLTICGTPGDISITGMSVGLPADYTYSWKPDSINGTPFADTDNTLASLDTGSYFVTATYNATRCPVNALEVSILDSLEYPAASLHLIQPQMSLNPGYQTGEVAADAIEEDGSVELYDFEWHRNSIPNMFAQATGVTVDTIRNQPEADYFVVARNTVSNCRDTASINVPLIPPTPEIIEVTVTHKTWCSPVNGALVVDSLALDGIGDDLANYEFYWYQDAYVDDLSQADFVTATPSLTDLPEGTYYIVARHTQLWVQSTPYQITVEDQSVLPVLALDRRLPQSSCNPDPAGHNGLLSIDIDNGADPTGYSISWFTGNTTLGTSLGISDTTVSGLTEMNYTVEVVNSTSGCINQATYFVPSDIPVVEMLTSVTPNRKCINPDGVISAIIQNPADYTVEWYAGNIVSGTPFDIGIVADSIAGGTYTGRAILISDPFCISAPVTDVVPDILVYPTFDIEIDAPVSNCDPAKPNGQASVENIVPAATYTAEWTEVASGTVVNTGLIGTNLSATEYAVRLYNTFTGCETTNNVTIPELLEVVPDPTITVLSQLTSCDTPNGALAADVNGNIIRYEFNWYDGDQEKSGADHLGNIYEDLDIGEYTVKAYDLNTGCWSRAVVGDIKDAREYPNIFIDFTSAKCELHDGSAALTILNGVNSDLVTWTHDLYTYEGVSIFDVPPGDFSIEVTTPLGCTTISEFNIPTEITIYNGVSANFDGLNDVFQVDCIDFFPGNNVKIFNRAGELVYEAFDYNNADKAFEGTGNRGLYLGSEDLPIGTYFYVIDLKDGSEAKTGYLELVR